MTRRHALTLTERVLQRTEQESLDLADDVWTEERSSFVDQDRHEADLRMLLRQPHVIGWAGEVAAANSYTTKEVLGIPVLVARSRDGQLRAFLNSCAHRGAQVATGCGRALRLSCPYHGWTYTLDGRLAGAPSRQMFEGLDLESTALRPLPVSEKHGLITVGLSPEVDLEGHLDDLADAFEGYDYGNFVHFDSIRYEVNANWKLAVDINFEGYHFPYAHRDTLDLFVSNHSVVDTFGRHCRWAFPFRDIVDLAPKPREEWPDEFHGTVVFGVFPSTVLVQSSGTAQMMRIYPADKPGESIVHLHYALNEAIPEGDDDLRAFQEAGWEGTKLVLAEEDIPQAEACQRGIAAGMERVVFGRNEPLLQHLAKHWQEAADDAR